MAESVQPCCFTFIQSCLVALLLSLHESTNSCHRSNTQGKTASEWGTVQSGSQWICFLQQLMELMFPGCWWDSCLRPSVSAIFSKYCGPVCVRKMNNDRNKGNTRSQCSGPTTEIMKKKLRKQSIHKSETYSKGGNVSAVKIGISTSSLDFCVPFSKIHISCSGRTSVVPASPVCKADSFKSKWGNVRQRKNGVNWAPLTERWRVVLFCHIPQTTTPGEFSCHWTTESESDL